MRDVLDSFIVLMLIAMVGFVFIVPVVIYVLSIMWQAVVAAF